ncbi:cell division protein FtsA [Prevotella sp. E13-17]|uniref:cell division protein FtsA n=1 Tax=Prevotella sp. E13-17 TaxID=2913616 RepID=UPI001ED9FD39|nr:cell division protein FtsA [Prevotella sp. E13-17]UKK51225.1 cell division protein FtsA [Prevotella sp. E13-17]
MAEFKDFIVAIELGSSKVTGIAGQKKPDGSISVLAMVNESSSAFIRKGVVYNIDKTAQCLTSIIKKLEAQLKTRITQVFVGVGGQSIRSVRNTVSRDLPDDGIITQEMVVELMDENRALDYPDQKILDVAEQEYRVDTQLQMDPVGIRAAHLEGNFLNILERKAFFQNLNKCFESAQINVAEMYLAPLALANAVLTEAEKRSGCALVDIGADTTTVSVFWKNVLRHLAVIPLGSNNITKDITSLQMEDNEAEQMKLKYASAYTDNGEIDPTLKYSISADRQVDSRQFIELVEGRVEEIIENVRYQIPAEYYDKLLGGIILTGGGSNMKNIEHAFTIYTHIEKVRVAKFVTMTINSTNEAIKARNGMYNTVLGLLAKGDMNCAGSFIDPDGNLFEGQSTPQPVGLDRRPRQPHEIEAGVIRSSQEEELAEKERIRKEEEEELAAERERLRLEEEERKKRKENSALNKLGKKLNRFFQKLTEDE